ncbi:hypothetical protein DICPUDRAFT_149601 [Dictyostelium purpureum]|uniref:Uncharacterized protein n=1 Tax=Dictyostelium purpureum TaxID=5786 RepID=F0ZE81_DICPU|nr:uncharacterized protein DICPUDRAFT_149601 [Dictyostelium purpureum]EGC37756.1 hypothetical protein DICPUDRAFT_149601 [Dictyostelium purpureum]|eukprot:XP_003285695.1 hypothetical protein DICPUDRAFT_149601 [Dictyostelium purpureum]
MYSLGSNSYYKSFSFPSSYHIRVTESKAYGYESLFKTLIIKNYTKCDAILKDKIKDGKYLAFQCTYIFPNITKDTIKLIEQSSRKNKDFKVCNNK